MQKYGRLSRSSARFRWAFETASESELMREGHTSMGKALELLEQHRVREGYYELVRAWVYIGEARTRGVQLEFFPDFGSEGGTHPE